jgi:recombination protein RecT
MSIALTVENEITTAVSSEVRNYVNEGMLILPPNYSAENALKSAMLTLPAITDKQGVPVLQSCTPPSIQQALLSMCMQGLNPDKKQCYFIAYAGKLTMSRSYFGDIAVVKQLDPTIEDVFAAVVYEGDEFTYEVYRGHCRNVVHKQKLSNKTKAIVGAYATIVYRNGKEMSTVMTYEQIKQSWKQSPIKPILANGTVNPDSTHGKFPEEMSKRTVRS